MTDAARSREFGRFLRKIRTEVHDETIRDFAKRIDLSSSYTHNLEMAKVSNPTRDTVEKIARRLAMEPDQLLLKAGYVPDSADPAKVDDSLLLLLNSLDNGQRAAARELLRTIKDGDIRVSPVPQVGDAR